MQAEIEIPAWDEEPETTALEDDLGMDLWGEFETGAQADGEMEV